jgi:hypothetical protein
MLAFGATCRRMLTFSMEPACKDDADSIPPLTPLAPSLAVSASLSSKAGHDDPSVDRREQEISSEAREIVSTPEELDDWCEISELRQVARGDPPRCVLKPYGALVVPGTPRGSERTLTPLPLLAPQGDDVEADASIHIPAWWAPGNLEHSLVPYLSQEPERWFVCQLPCGRTEATYRIPPVTGKQYPGPTRVAKTRTGRKRARPVFLE